MNILPQEMQLEVLKHLVDGCGIRSTERLTGVSRNTVMSWLVRLGGQAKKLLDVRLRNLRLKHIQLDEQWTYVKQKTRNLNGANPSVGIGDYWIFIALDTQTKLVPSCLVGRRNEPTTKKFVNDLASRLAWPKPRESDGHEQYRQIIQLSSDAWFPYREAISSAFGRYASYGQIVKYSEATERQPEKWAERRPIRGPIDTESICTSHVERNNLTRRHFMRRLCRRTLCFSKKVENLRAATALHIAHYNFCWRSRMPGSSGKLLATPAMAAKVVNSLWSIEDLYYELMTM